MPRNSVDEQLAKKRKREVNDIKHLWFKILIHPYTYIIFGTCVIIYFYNNKNFKTSINFLIFMVAEYFFIKCYDEKIQKISKNS